MDPESYKAIIESISALKNAGVVVATPQTPSTLSVLAPTITTLGSTLIGALSAFLPNWYLNNHKSKQEKRSVQNSILAEVQSLLTVITKRDYLEELYLRKKHIEDIAHSRGGNFHEHVSGFSSEPLTVPCAIIFPEGYNKVYATNIDKLGLLEPSIVSRVVKFYALLESLLQDVRDGGVLAEGGYYIHYVQAIIFLEEALDIAKSLAIYNNKQHSNFSWKFFRRNA